MTAILCKVLHNRAKCGTICKKNWRDAFFSSGLASMAHKVPTSPFSTALFYIHFVHYAVRIVELK